MNQEVSVNELNKKIEDLVTLRSLYDSKKQESKEALELLDKCESELLELLNRADLKSFKSQLGTVSKSVRTSVKIPREESDREAFFSYLKDRGLYDSMITVNSQSLNAFYKKELESSIERGDTEFSIPGINEETINEILSFRKA